jgi:soluble lytic murein transglycosylase
MAGRNDTAHSARRPCGQDRLARAFTRGDAAKLARYAAALKGSPLHPYVEFWSLEMRIEDSGYADAMRDFMERQSGSMLAEQLRRDWLRVLGKREQWDLFEEQFPRLLTEDANTTCYALQARWRRGDEAALAELATHWQSPRELPTGCIPLARAMIQSGRYGAAQLWDRFRLLTDVGLMAAAKRVTEYLPPADAVDQKKMDSVVASPAKHLEQLPKDLSSRATRELAILAIDRLARNDPEIASSYWDDKLRARFTASEQAYVWTVLGTQGARRHLPESMNWFARAANAPMSDDQFAWRTRIALRHGNWTDVRMAIEQMTTAARNDPTWVYWLGRALREQGHALEAQAAFTRIAEGHHFYGRLAGEELGIAMQLPPQAAKPTQEEMEQAANHPGMQRALALFRLGQRLDAIREWNWTIRGMDDRMLLAIAHVARNNEYWDRAINTADRTVSSHDFTLRYLMPHRNVFTDQAKIRQLEEPWVLGLVRQESRFLNVAKSTAGAAGLMQLMPATATWIAKRIGMKDFAWSRVNEPDVNVALGTSYLRHVLDDLDGNPVLAAAAYNAGPGRARRWRDTKPLEGAIYAESIPFNETRDYVKKVMSNTVYYAAVMGGESRPLKARLGVIAPRGGERLMSVKLESGRP